MSVEVSRRRWLHRLCAGAGLALSAPLLQACSGTVSTAVKTATGGAASSGATTATASTAAATTAAATAAPSTATTATSSAAPTTLAATASTASASAAAAPASGVTLDFTNWAYAETSTGGSTC